MTKRVDMEYTQRVDFLIGPNIKMASIKRYEKEIMMTTGLD